MNHSEPTFGARPIGRPRQFWLWIEMLAIFFGLPGLVALYVDPQRRLDEWFGRFGVVVPELPFPRFQVLMPTLVVFTVIVALVLVLSRGFPTRQLWNWSGFRGDVKRILGLFAVAAPLMLALAWALHTYSDVMLVRGPDGERGSTFLYLPRNLPIILVLIGVLYPWFSAYPQEITHRAFFFHRYGPILGARWAMIGVNAMAFSWLHAPFWNWIALAMTLPAGVLFAWTYDRTRSTLAAGFEHAIYGWWVFFTGLGFFVYAGSLGA